MRARNLRPDELDEYVKRDIPLQIAQKFNAAPTARTQEQIETSLAAYCEFHRQSVLRAVGSVSFRFDSRAHLNDHFDGEQLLYLALPDCHFISSDSGFNCVTRTLQGHRVHIIRADTLQNPATATPALEQVIAGCSPARP